MRGRPSTRAPRPASAQREGARVGRRSMLLGTIGLASCTRGERAIPERARRRTLTVKVQPTWGDPSILRARVRAFEQEHDVNVSLEALPNASEITRQYLVTALGGHARGIDVFVADIVWIAEFARAGWIRDISRHFPPKFVRETFVPGAASAVVLGNATYAIPWYVDVGLLYYRTDLVPRPPRTYEELRELAARARRDRPGTEGYLWQGRQSEALVCNAFEAMWGFGACTLQSHRVIVDSPEARDAMRMLRGFIVDGTSPGSVASAAEEDGRRAFQRGGAAFLRNWPYAFAELAKADSPVRGRVGTTTLPTRDGERGAGALGGWQLAVSAFAPEENLDASAKFIAAMTSLDANVDMAVAYGRCPARSAAYLDPVLQRETPFIASLREAVERARPRPVTPYYGMMSDALQGELSAIVTGVRSPEAALGRAQALIDRLVP